MIKKIIQKKFQLTLRGYKNFYEKQYDLLGLNRVLKSCQGLHDILGRKHGECRSCLFRQ